jgi:hypothetical protein
VGYRVCKKNKKFLDTVFVFGLWPSSNFLQKQDVPKAVFRQRKHLIWWTPYLKKEADPASETSYFVKKIRQWTSPKTEDCVSEPYIIVRAQQIWKISWLYFLSVPLLPLYFASQYSAIHCQQCQLP